MRPAGPDVVARPIVLVLALVFARDARAQVVTYRGWVEGKALVFPQQTPNDPERLIGDARGRLEVFFGPSDWIQVASGVEAWANSYNQVDGEAALNISDRGVRRPALSLRRLSATLSRRAITFEIGKQFVRWGKADVVTPTDRFAPRDFLNVIDAEVMPIRAARLAVVAGSNAVEGVVSTFTPSRTPLFDQRWTVVPPGAAGIVLRDGGSRMPSRLQAGVRWSHTGRGFETSVAFFDGFNHLPNIELSAIVPASTATSGAPGPRPLPAAVGLVRSFPTLRMYGADTAVPTPWVTLKGEVAYFETRTAQTDEFVLYVIQAERQTGEWLLLGGYAGEVVTSSRTESNFAPDRGLTRAIIGRASYTIDATRSAALEAALRQNGDGVYIKGELSKATGQHWRTTVSGAVIRGAEDDFLGQYRRNSHVGVTLRYSF